MDVRSEPACADLSRKRYHQTVPVQRLLPGGRSAGGRRLQFQAEVGGLVDNKKPWTLDELYALPQETQITRAHLRRGLERDRKLTGVRLSEFLRRIGADTKAKYVWFQCAEGYSNKIDMPTALHPQTQLTFKFGDEILPRKYGFPMKCRIPIKLGFKNPKYVIAMHVTNTDLRRLLGKSGL